MLATANSINSMNSFSVKINKDIEHIHFDEIYFVEAMGNYMKLHLKNKNLVTYSSLKNLQDQLPREKFIKVQKSFIVAKDKIEKIFGNFIQIDGKRISISRNSKNEILSEIR